MKIIIGHNYYQFPGGEDAVVKSEYAMLKRYGHKVILYERRNTELNTLSVFGKIMALCNVGYSKKTYSDFRTLLKKEKPDVAHFHNLFFMITPSVYYACRDEGVPVVQSLHNFRLLCANALFFREGRVCEECLETALWRGAYYGCYKNSRILTTLIVLMLRNHWKRFTWEKMIDRYITATEFTRSKYTKRGIASDKISIKPNFYFPDPGVCGNGKKYALYVGRLSIEKGVDILLDAWESVHSLPLKIIGDGPLAGQLKKQFDERRIQNVEFLGFVNAERYDRCMREAKFLIIPSLCYENFPRIVAEAFAYGKPVIASRFGSLQEIITHGKTGLLFSPGDARDLAEKIRVLAEHNEMLEHMSISARKEFEMKYTAEINYELLIAIYKRAISRDILSSCENRTEYQ